MSKIISASHANIFCSGAIVTKVILTIIFILSAVSWGLWIWFSGGLEENEQILRAKIEKILFSTDPLEWNRVITQEDRESNDITSLEGRLELARQASISLLKFTTPSATDLENRGVIEKYSGNLIEALEWYNRSSSINPHNQEIQFRRAKVCAKLGYFERARGSLLSIVDLFPYKANVGLGALFLEYYQAEEAYLAYNRADLYAESDSELFEVAQGKAKSLELYISLQKDLKNFGILLRNPRLFGISKEMGFSTVQDSHKLLVSRAIKLFYEIHTASKREFVAIQPEILALSQSKGDLESLNLLRNSLIEFVRTDHDHLEFPIYLLLGEVNLFLAYHPQMSKKGQKGHINEAITNFRTVFSYDFERRGDEFEYVLDWGLSLDISQELFEGHLLLRISRCLLMFPEYWRILTNQDLDQQSDSLEIKFRLKKATEREGMKKTLLQDLQILSLVASAKQRNLEIYHDKLKDLFGSVSGSEKVKLAHRISKGLVSFSPNQLDLFLDLIDTQITNFFKTLVYKDLNVFETLKNEVDVLCQLRNHRNSINEKREILKVESEKLEVDVSLKSINELLGILEELSTTPNMVITASNLMSSLVSVDDSIKILRVGSKHYPHDKDIRFELVKALLQKVMTDPKEFREAYFKDIFKELFLLFGARDADGNKILAHLFSIGTQIKKDSLWFNRILVSLLSPLYPKLSDIEINIFSESMKKFIKKDFQETLVSIQDIENKESIGPFLFFLKGICCLELANRPMNSNPSEQAWLSNDANDIKSENIIPDFQNNARLAFEDGLELDGNYFPLSYNLAKLKLDVLSFGQEVPGSLMDKISSLMKNNPNLSQFKYLFAHALRKKREFLITQNIEIKVLKNILLEERAALRDSIRKDSSRTDAYEALAATYTLGRNSDDSFFVSYEEKYKELGKPNFNLAITILASAPSSPEILDKIAQYYKAQNRLDQKIEVYKELIRIEPTEVNLFRVINSIIETGDFNQARAWVNSLDPDKLFLEDLNFRKAASLAFIDFQEANSLATTSSRRETVKESQIKNLKAAIKKAGPASTRSFDLEVSLAYLLAEKGMVDEAMKRVETLKEKVRITPKIVPDSLLNELNGTYAYVLFRSNRIEKAKSIFQELCSKKTNLKYHLNYAELLIGIEEPQPALDQLEIILKFHEQSPLIEKQAKKFQEAIKAGLMKLPN